MADMPQSKSRTTNGRFVKGHPGGPGRPRKIVTAAADDLDARVAEKPVDLFDIALKQADEGNTAALKMLLDRVWPVGRNRPLGTVLPEAATIPDTMKARTVVANAVLAGEATIQEGAALTDLLKAHEKAVTHHDHVRWLADILLE